MAKKAAPDPRYWLFKSEPESYSIEDLSRDKRTFWDGVRNYQARNSLRDDIHVGDGVLFYHSGCDPLVIVGTMCVVRQGYPDSTAFEKSSHHFDPKSDPAKPTWFMVDVKFRSQFAKPVTRATLESTKGLEKMVLLQRGSRLSIQPVTATEWRIIHKLAGANPTI